MKPTTRLGLLNLLAVVTICAACSAHALPLDSTPLLAGDPPAIGQPIAAGEIPGQGAALAADNPAPPASPVKLIFVHHSCGQNWLADVGYDEYAGGLGQALQANNYYVSDTNYDWGPDSIGSSTDIGHWWTWVRGPSSATYLNALYNEFGEHSEGSYSRGTDPDPSRENEIVMFKSCYPNSNLGGSTSDPPTTGSNPLRGESCDSEHHTIGNAKGIYNDLLAYFASRPDKLFIAVTAPPQVQNYSTAAEAANARALNNWLVNDWLDGYAYDNVAVFDFYNVLTSNGGSATANDVGQETGNHHRWWNGSVQHVHDLANDYAAYGSDPWDGHPTAAGNQKATAEFVPLLNVFYHRWQAGSAPGPALSLTSPQGGELWPTGSARQIQ